MSEYTVIVRCCCGCDGLPDIHHVYAPTKQEAVRVAKNSIPHERTVELVCVLKGHCEEA